MVALSTDASSTVTSIVSGLLVTVLAMGLPCRVASLVSMAVGLSTFIGPRSGTPYGDVSFWATGRNYRLFGTCGYISTRERFCLFGCGRLASQHQKEAHGSTRTNPQARWGPGSANPYGDVSILGNGASLSQSSVELYLVQLPNEAKI